MTPTVSNKAALIIGGFLSSSSFLTTTVAFQGGILNRYNPADTVAHHHRIHAEFSQQSTEKAASATYGIDAPYKEANYDPHAAAEYYKERPVESLFRLTQIVSKSSGFIIDTILDSKLNRVDRVSFNEFRENVFSASRPKSFTAR